MPKIMNTQLSGQRVAFSQGVINFDDSGVGEILDEEVCRGILKLANFHPIVEPTHAPVIEQTTKKVVTPVSVKTKK